MVTPELQKKFDEINEFVRKRVEQEGLANKVIVPRIVALIPDGEVGAVFSSFGNSTDLTPDERIRYGQILVELNDRVQLLLKRYNIRDLHDSEDTAMPR
jgi:hypothetical protein